MIFFSCGIFIITVLNDATLVFISFAMKSLRSVSSFLSSWIVELLDIISNIYGIKRVFTLEFFNIWLIYL